jgi:hypothetical protein
MLPRVCKNCHLASLQQTRRKSELKSASLRKLDFRFGAICAIYSILRIVVFRAGLTQGAAVLLQDGERSSTARQSWRRADTRIPVGGTPIETTEWSAVLLQILCDTLSNSWDPSNVSATAGKIIVLRPTWAFVVRGQRSMQSLM